MSPVHAPFGRHRWIECVVVTSLLCASPMASADEHHYVLRDGRKVALEKSQSEVGVLLRRDANVEKTRRRLADSGHGTLRDMKGAARARVKILHVADTKQSRRAAIRTDRAVESVHAVYRFAGIDSPVLSTGTMVTKLAGGLTEAERAAMWDEYGIVEVNAFAGLVDVYILRAADGVDEVLLAEHLAEDGRTAWANPDFRRAIKRHQIAGADEFLNLQWHLDNTGQAGGTVDADIDAPEAWSIADGSGVLFGMLDDSCDVDHEDLVGNYIGVGQDIALPFFDADFNNPRPKRPFDQHGTAVMGLAAASANSVGVRGVAFGARFTASRGLFEVVQDSAVASAYSFAVQEGVDVHINSWGFTAQFPVPPVLQTAIETAFEQGRDLDGPGGNPPLGMVILFSSGNSNDENLSGLALSTLPQVISVGASTGNDLRAGFSSFGKHLSVLAPGGSGINIGITTTDVEDGPDQPTQGYNVNGSAFGNIDIDPNGSYTGFFGGTSAACPIAAGVAGLILSANPQLTAMDVRLILEHTTDRVSPSDAQYDALTQRSFKYGYGRVNAERAVQAAVDSLNNGGFTWPESPANIRAVGSTLHWEAGRGTKDFIVLESTSSFSFTPQDGACYSTQQTGCAAAAVIALPADVTLLDVVSCSGLCAAGAAQSVGFVAPTVGTKLFAVWGRSEVDRYSFGARTESSSIPPPSVTIVASPLVGASPLTVSFNGNAVSDIGIDPNGTIWDFDINDPSTLNQTTPTATHTYEAGAGEIRVFTARLVMRDTLGSAGSADVQIRVIGGTVSETASSAVGPNIRVVVSVPGTTGSDIATGISPFSVELRVESDTTANVQSVVWHLGDGSPAVGGLAVPHTYVNETSSDMVLPVTATVTTQTSSGAVKADTATRLITVLPGAAVVDVGIPNLPGTTPQSGVGSSLPCGGVGMVPLFFGLTGLMLLRRRHL